MKFKGNTKTTQQTSLLKHAKRCKRGPLHSIASVAFSLLVPAPFALGGCFEVLKYHKIHALSSREE